jgi:hypothetical protein
VYGRFGYAGGAIVGDIGFENPFSAQDWRSSTWQTGGFNWTDFSSLYTPLAPAVIDAANAQWQKLQDAVDLAVPASAKAQSRLDRLRVGLAAAIAASDELSPKFASAPHLAGMRAINFNLINQLLTAFANEKWADPIEEMAQADATQATTEHAAAVFNAKLKEAASKAAQASASRLQTQDAIANAQAAIAAAAHAKDVADHALAKKQSAQAMTASSRPSVAVIAAVAVPLAVIAYLALRSKKSSVSGYRRRRRSR